MHEDSFSLTIIQGVFQSGDYVSQCSEVKTKNEQEPIAEEDDDRETVSLFMRTGSNKLAKHKKVFALATHEAFGA